MRYGPGTSGAPKGRPPRPYHVAGLRNADAILKAKRGYGQNPTAGARQLRKLGVSTKEIRQVHADHLQKQRLAAGFTGRGVQAQPASKQAKPLSRNEQLQLAVNVGLKRAGIEKHIKSSGIGNPLRAPALLTRGGTQFGTDLLYAGPGAAITAKNVGVDIKEALPGTRGGPGFKRSRAAGVGIVKHVYGDVRHPRENIGHLGFDVAAGLAGGGGTVARGAAATRALRAGEGVGRAATRKGHEGGSLLHAPEPGTVRLRVGGATVEKPLSRNAALRQVQKARYARKQARLDQRRGSIQTEPGGAPGRATEALTAPEHTFGRRLRVERRMEQAHAKGDLTYVHRLGKNLNRDEHTALRVAAIEGHGALSDPLATIDRQIATHEHHIAAGEDKAAHQSIIRDLEAARRVLVKPSARFQDALAATRALSHKGEAESISRGFLSQSTADTRRIAIAKAYGYKGDTPPEGSFYFHAGLGKRKPGQLGRVYEPRPGDTGMAPPQIGRYAPEMRRQFKALGVTKGSVPVDIPRAVTEGYGRRMVAHSAHDLYGTLKKGSTATRESRYQIPLRADAKISGELRKYLTTIEDNLHASPDALQAMTKQQVERLAQELEAAEHHNAPLGANIKGVRWVDRRMIKDLGQTSVRGWFEKTADAVTNPIRFGTLYLRPAYAMNALGNAGMLVPEGAAAGSAVGRALRMPRRIGEQNTAWVDASMGTGKALGQQVGTGLGHRATHAIAEGWNKATDLHARRAAFEIEARRAGIRTQADFDRLRTDPQLASKRREVTERARAIIGDYENLTPVEKNQVRRALYFWPWTKVAVNWTGHTLGEHPIKSAVLAQNSRSEAEHAKRLLGQIPAWARQSGLIPVGKAHGGLIDTVNPSSVNTPATVTQTGAAAANAARGLIGLPQKPGAGLADLLTPAFESFVSAGGQTPAPGHHTGVLGAAEQTPIPSALRRLGVYGKPSKTYPATGVGAAVKPLAFGGLAKRPTSLTALHKAGEKELVAGLSPDQHTAHDFTKFRGEMRMAIQRKYGHAEIPKVVDARLNLWHERAAARRRAAHGSKLATRDGIASDFDVLAAHGWITKSQAATGKANLAKVPNAKLGSLTRYLTTTYFDRDNFLHEASKHLGVTLPRLP